MDLISPPPNQSDTAIDGGISAIYGGSTLSFMKAGIIKPFPCAPPYRLYQQPLGKDLISPCLSKCGALRSGLSPPQLAARFRKSQRDFSIPRAISALSARF
eukprot:444471-Rhodomonas_salina.1